MSVALAVALAAAAAAAPAAETREPAAVAVARRTLAAMGGEEGFAKLRTLKFDFVVERDGSEIARIHHVWDRWDGRYRVEGKTRTGSAFLTLLNVQKRGEGRAWLDGRELGGDERRDALERGYGRFINDTYWLLMPAKMLDPGVHLASEGEMQRDGKTFDVVRLTFDDGIGLTPKDTYWAFVAKDTGLMERWEFVLTGQKPEEREAFVWEDWQPVGGVRLSLAKKAAGDGTVIKFDHVSGSGADDDAAFAAP